MNYPGVWKECKFCGMRYDEGTGKCPKCGSGNARLVMPKEMEADRIFFAEEKVRKDKEQAEKKAKKQKSVRKWKKAFCILGITVGILLVVCIVASLLIGFWAMRMSQKDTEKSQESTENIVSMENTESTKADTTINEEELDDEEWLEWMLPKLDELYAEHEDEEIVAIYKKAMKDNRPIYMWDHYMYGDVLYNHSNFEEMWAREHAGEILRELENTILLNYYLLYWDFEESYIYTDEEKAWLRQYVDELREDVEWRWGQTKEDFEVVHAILTAKDGYVDYEMLKEYVKNSYVWVYTLIITTESMDDDAWKVRMFPVLDELFKEGNDKEISLIYTNTETFHKEVSRPFNEWQHADYMYFMEAMCTLEYYWERIDAGKRVSENDYIYIISTYLRYVDDLNEIDYEYNFTDEEKEHIVRNFNIMEGHVVSLWDFSEGEWKALLEKSKTKNVDAEIEWLVSEWLQEMDVDKQTEEPEIIE